MRTFKVSLMGENGVRTSGAVIVERRRNDTWVREREITLLTGTPSSEMTIVVEDGQRLIIEAPPETEVVYDREQNAAIAKPVHRGPEPAEARPAVTVSPVPRTVLPPVPRPPMTTPPPGSKPTVAPYEENSKESLADRDARQFEENRRAAMTSRTEEPKKG